ncbi:MAG: RNA methyltransferase [Bacteroidales bacterium]|nr:RNA methyltransferase [Bacteroidales bacterium]
MRDRKLLGSEMGRVPPSLYKSLPESGIVLVLDNIRSAHNVGSAFRTADAFKADRLYLCGICACPPSAEIHKSALGAEDSVPWEYRESTLSLVEELRARGYYIICAEQTENALPLQSFRLQKGSRVAVVFGNEVDGVSQEVVDAADGCVEIPQFGTKHSLNVSVSIGIVLWQCVSGNL